MTASTRLVLLLLAVLVLAGCGGNGAVGEPAENGGTIPAVPPGDDPDAPAAAPSTYQTTEFEPPFSFQHPAGWRVEELMGIVTAFRGTGDTWALSFEALPDGGTVDAKVAELRENFELEAEEPQPATVGGHDGMMFNAEVVESGILDGSDYFVIQHSLLRTWVIDVEGTLVAIFAEARSLRMDARDEETDAAFFNESEQILQSLEFGAAPAG